MSKPLRVVHITSAHKDGDVRIFHKECVSLAAAGFEVFLVVPNTKPRLEKGVNIVSFEDSGSSRFRRAIKTVNRVYETAIKLDGDIYHLHDPELLRLVPKFKRLGKKVVYDSHEDLPRQVMSKEYLPVSLRKLISWLTEKYENHIVRKLDGVITATPFIGDRFLKYHQNVVVVNNYPMLSEIDLIVPGNFDREKSICYIGAISEIRGIEQLINSLEICEVKLYLAGEMLPELRSKYERLNGWKYVEYLGQIDREESIKIKHRCFAGVVTFLPAPNHVNAQPNKLFEYMGSGLPVICSDFDLWKILIEKNRTGICVNPKDINAIARAILNLSESDNLVSEMGKKGITLVSQKYNWASEEKILVEFYKKKLKT